MFTTIAAYRFIEVFVCVFVCVNYVISRVLLRRKHTCVLKGMGDGTMIGLLQVTPKTHPLIN